MGDIIWLASYPKSGNTWMRAFLHNLFHNEARPVDVNRMQGAMLQSDGALMWFQMVDKRPVSAWSSEDVAAMRPRVCELIARGQPGSIFCKTHNALMTVHGHATINLQVTSGAIYIVRNPLDVAASSADFMGTDLDQAIALMATDYLEMPHDPERNNVSIVSGSWSQHVASWTGRASERLHVVRYEDMIDKPSATFGGVARFLGLKPSRQRLLRAIRNSSFEAMRRQEERHGFKERSAHQEGFFRRGTAGGWKEELTDEQVRRICETHGEQMKRFGYLSPGVQPAIG
ncbi:MAG: sulfotransferase domain-containing protein [bacterium]|nr:sulfotransferase domain-containing protein [bacterium]